MKIKIAVIAMVTMCLGIKAQNEVSTYFQVNADNSNGYVASKIYLKSHSNDRGTGLFTLGQTNNWFIGNPYTDHANSFMIGVSNKSDGIDPIAQKSFAKFYLNANGRVGIGTTTPSAKLDVSGNLAFIAPGGTWITGKTGNGGITSNTQLQTGTYHSLIRQKTSSGHTVNLGGIGNYFGIFGFDKNRTSNGYDHNMVMNLENGNIGIGVLIAKTKLEINGNLSFTAPGSSWITGKTGNGGITSNTQLVTGSYHSLIRQKTSSGHTVNLGGVGDFFGFFGFDKNRINNGYDHNMVINLNTGNVGIGTLNTGNHKLAVEGSIGAREIKVEASGWSDFVFEKEYKLPTLIEVEKHIKEKGHLKDIPSAKDVEKNGFFLGEMDAKLLQKIEELTLYTLKQEKRLNSQSKEIKALKQQNSKIAKQEKELKELKILVKRLLEK